MKSKSNIPRRKRLSRSERLRIAKQWIKKYNGKRIVHGYAKWFGVSKLCAIKELRMNGIEVSVVYEKQLKQYLDHKAKQKELIKQKQEEKLTVYDDDFSFIAGYTSWDFPYEIPCGENEENENIFADSLDDDDDLPF